MTCAGWHEVEALIDGELSGPRAWAAREHLAACAPCAAEARGLRAERALFAARARVPAAAPPAFAGVLGRTRKAERSPAWLSHASTQGLGLAAAAAILGLTLARRPPVRDEGGAPVAKAEPVPGLVCAETSASATPHETALACLQEERLATLAMTPAPPPDVTGGGAVASCRRLVLGEDEGSCEPGCEGSCP